MFVATTAGASASKTLQNYQTLKKDAASEIMTTLPTKMNSSQKLKNKSVASYSVSKSYIVVKTVKKHVNMPTDCANSYIYSLHYHRAQ